MSNTSNIPQTKKEIEQLFENRIWHLSHGVIVRTHKYDDTHYAFEVTQHKKCLGTIIPNNIGDMLRMEYVLNHDLDIDGFPCNDEFNTIIRVKK